MFKTTAVVRVIDEACVGCTVCVNVCPSDAIRMQDRLAVVTEDRCTGCLRCMEACMPYGAIRAQADPNPRVFETPEKSWDRDAVEDICAQAYLSPEDSICLCTLTTAGEVAAAIANGTTSLEDLPLETGVRAQCGMWCLAPTMRLLHAAGVELDRPAKDYRVYTDGAGTQVGLWNITDEVIAKYPEYPLEADRAAAIKHGLGMPHFPSIQLQRLADEREEDSAQ